MDVPDFTSLIGNIRGVVSLLKDALGLLPKGKDKETLARLIEETEKKSAAMEADAAVRLGYQICRAHWPPVVMLETEKRNIFRCPECNKEVDTSPASFSSAPVARSKWMLR